MRRYPLLLLHTRTALSIVGSAALVGCAESPVGLDALNPTLRSSLATAASSSTVLIASRTQTTFTIGPLGITAIEQRFPGDRWQFRDAALNGPVAGDITGSADLTLNGNFDKVVGSGPAWGTLTIRTSGGDVWQGALTGQWKSGLPEPGIQLFSKMVLRGPGGQTLKAECDETTATSETLACSGELLDPPT